MASRRPKVVATTNADLRSHRPVRTCVGCRRRTIADELVRCALDGDSRVSTIRSAPGRGAWVCGPDCVETARRRRGFERAWRRAVPDGALDDLAQRLRERPAGEQMTRERVVRPSSHGHERLTTRVKG